MPPPKRILNFALWVTAIMVALLLPWPGLGNAYAAGFRELANVLFGSIGADGSVRFEPNPQPAAGMDTIMALGNRGTGAQAHAPLSVRMIGYVPTVLVIALCIATPARWPRRLAVLGVAILLVQAFIFLRVYLRLVEIFSAGDTLSVFDFGTSVSSVIQTLSQVLSVSLLGSFVAPGLIWTALGLRPADWQDRPRSSTN